PLRLDAERVLRILVALIGKGRQVGTRALEIAEGGTAPGVEERLDRGVRVLGRVMDLRDVVHGRDAVVELAQSREQLVDVYILRAKHRSERQKNEFEVGGGAARRARLIVDEDPIGEEAPHDRLELV